MPPDRLQLPKMRLWALLPFLAPFFFPWNIQEPELAEGFFIRSCPRVRVKCEVQERNECTRHKQCPDKKRCCPFACGKKCLDTKEDVCSLPQDSGPCLAYFPRWRYDQETKLCTQFIYGGCQGNSNNFLSKDVCVSICINKKRMYQDEWVDFVK
ncbi:WAP four-disulfide core domain protein 6A-like [Psammomys obesus]|uniref:WAP four-disulfide core domain protein 6A-like n=1 Tax=Psammomys obesus TaxID=48139 RepID=UPI0024536838|nr:WAP four-disulfide core domain protein 6A-like [Psammomys obesus]